MDNEKLTMLKVETITPHPDNPRKDIGDISELAESIKKNGIMQNLTVIPGKAAGKYICLIGHRRLAAAKKIGLQEVPVQIIENLTYREQISVMLEENMQRHDLTVVEQAEGFQMMLDLGESEESIAEKTGFSRTTVRHRLEIAKLNKKALLEKENDKEFQLNLTDLYALEEIKDIKVRNEILKDATSSNDLRRKAIYAVKEAKRDEAAEEIIAELEKMGVKKATSAQINKRWDSTAFKQIKSFDLDQGAPKKIQLAKPVNAPAVWYKSWQAEIIVYVILKSAEQENSPTEEDLEREQKEKAKKELKELTKRLRSSMVTFVNQVLDGSYTCDTKADDLVPELWSLIYGDCSIAVWKSDVYEMLHGKGYYNVSVEERDAFGKAIADLPMLHQMLLSAAVQSTKCESLYKSYDGTYDEEAAKRILPFAEFLKHWDYSVEDEELIEVLNGTHKLYAKKVSRGNE